MKKIMIDPKLLQRYMKFVAKGDVTPSINSFLAYQEATRMTILEAKRSSIKSEAKTVYRINVNERLDFNHTYTVELPSSVNDEDVWNVRHGSVYVRNQCNPDPECKSSAGRICCST